MNYEQIIAENLLQIQAVKLSPESPFTWASGWKSPIYCDNRKALSFHQVRTNIVKGMAKLIAEKFTNISAIAGVATAGIAWGALVAQELELPFSYVRPKPKEHGLGNQIEGNLVAGDNVVVIEDLISTGKSSLQVVDVLLQQNIQVSGMVSIFNYGFTKAQEAFAAKQLPFYSLTNYPTLLQIALQQNIISNDNIATLEAWSSNPEIWGK